MNRDFEGLGTTGGLPAMATALMRPPDIYSLGYSNSKGLAADTWGYTP